MSQVEITDELVLNVVNGLMGVDGPSALVVQKLWADRRVLLDGINLIADWDMTHDEALTAERAKDIANDARGEIVPVPQ